MYYPSEVVEQVIAANDIVDVIGSYVHLKKSGASYMGLCPFHNEKTPSFSVSPGKQVFHCFGCGEGGNAVTFLMKYENLTFQEALKNLADRAGIRLPEEDMSEGAKQKQQLKARLLQINKDTATYYYRLLRSPKGQRGMEYLAGRALSAQTMQNFGLGFADGASNDLVRFLRRKGYSDEDILQSGVAAYDEKRGLHDKFWNRVMFPIMDVSNKVIGFGGRVMGDGKPKYLNSPETPVFDKSTNLYGLNIAKRGRSPYFILCEGYMDVIAMHQAGFTQAIASLGTAFTQGQAAIIKRYVKTVLLSYDSDGAGVAAALRNIGILKEAGITAKVVDLRPCKDPDEFIKTNGADAFKERLDNAENSFFYELRQMEGSYSMDDPDARTQFYRNIAKKLCEFEDEIERENYIHAAAVKYYIPEDSLRREVASYTKAGGAIPAPAVRPRPKNAAKEAGISAAKAALMQSQRLLMTWISDNPQLYVQLRDYIGPEDFEEGVFRQAAEKYFSMLNEGMGDRLTAASGSARAGDASCAAVISIFDDETQQKEAASLFETRIAGLDSPKEKEKALRDVLLAVKRGSLERLAREQGSSDALKKIMETQQQIAKIGKLQINNL